MMETLLKVTELTIRYHSAGVAAHEAVTGVSFDVARGEILGVIGESGCGKTSIALALLGLLSRGDAEVSGSVVFRGEDLLAMNEKALQKTRGASISMVYQEPGIALSPVMRVGTQIAEIVRAHRKYSRQECREKAFAMLGRVGLPSTERIFSAYPNQLPATQRVEYVDAAEPVCGPRPISAEGIRAGRAARPRAQPVLLEGVVERFLPLACAEMSSVFAAAGTSVSAAL